MIIDTYVNILLPDRLSPERYQATCSIFRDTADEDYFFARVAWKNLNVRQFSWSASQAVEKYLKCALLIQGFDAKFRHNWYEKVSDLWTVCERLGYTVAPNLEPVNCEIAILGGDNYRESLSDFLGRISKNGHIGIRYNEYDYLDIDTYDLHKLDSVCYLLRGLCIPVDGELLEDNSQAGVPNPALISFPRKIKDSTHLSTANYSFFPEQAGAPSRLISGSSSPVAMLIAKGDYSTVKWLTENTMLNKTQVKKMTFEIQKTKASNG